MKQLLVGIGKACISPNKEMFPILIYENQYYEDMLQDVYARAIALDNGDTKFLFISVECNPTIYKEHKEYISEKYDIPIDHIFATCTHNHSAPFWDNVTPKERLKRRGDTPEGKSNQRYEYGLIVVKGVYEAVEQAMSHMIPARFGFGEGKSYINTNRDGLFEDGHWMQDQNYAGPSDKTLAMLKFEDYDGNLVAAVMNYGCHATCAFCVKDTDGKIKVTAGFPGIACDYVEKRYALTGPEPVVMWTSGASGDQCPIFSSEGFPRIYEIDGYTETIPTPPGTQYIIQRHVGWTHAIDAIRTLKTIDCDREYIKITTALTSVDLVGQKAPEGFDRRLCSLITDNFVRRYRPDLLVDGKQPSKDTRAKMIPHGTVELKMQLFIFDDVAWVGASGELYCELGWKCKEESPFKKTVVVNHIDGQAAGYVISDASAHHDVFESYNRVHPGDNDRRVLAGERELFRIALNS